MVRRYAGFALFLPFVLISHLACGPSSSAPEISKTSNGELVTAAASSAPSLGTAGSFAILGGSAVTCTDSAVTGNVGVSPGNTITQTRCPVTGNLDRADGPATRARNDFLTAYAQFAALPCDSTLTTLGQTLAPGVYCFDAAATATGAVLTLDGPANGLWIFKVGTLGTGALTGTSFSVVSKAGTPLPCNSVYWWVADAVTMTDSNLVGNILAGAAVTLNRGTFNGDAFAKAAVTITGTAFTSCALGAARPPACTDADREKHKDGHVDGRDKHEHGDDECEDEGRDEHHDDRDGGHRDGGDRHDRR